MKRNAGRSPKVAKTSKKTVSDPEEVVNMPDPDFEGKVFPEAPFDTNGKRLTEIGTFNANRDYVVKTIIATIKHKLEKVDANDDARRKEILNAELDSNRKQLDIPIISLGYEMAKLNETPISKADDGEPLYELRGVKQYNLAGRGAAIWEIDRFIKSWIQEIETNEKARSKVMDEDLYIEPTEDIKTFFGRLLLVKKMGIIDYLKDADPAMKNQTKLARYLATIMGANFKTQVKPTLNKLESGRDESPHKKGNPTDKKTDAFLFSLGIDLKNKK